MTQALLGLHAFRHHWFAFHDANVLKGSVCGEGGVEEEGKELTFVAGQRESALFELVGVCVDAGAVLQEHAGHFNVASAGRLHQGSVSILVVVLNVGTFLQQHFDHIQEASRARIRQSRVAWGRDEVRR